MNKFKITAVGALLGVMVFAVQSEASVAEITLMKGEVSYHSAEEDLWQTAELGLQLEAGAAVKSGTDSEVELSFYNGHQANLGSNSSMQIKSMGNDTTLELFQGKLKSKVRKLAKNENYKVSTTEGVASVRGTFFEVIKIGENTDVKVDEGSVNVQELTTGEVVNVIAGKFTKVKKNQPPTPPEDLENYQELEGSDTDQSNLEDQGDEEEGDDEGDQAQTDEEGDDEGDQAQTDEEGDIEDGQVQTGDEGDADDSLAQNNEGDTEDSDTIEFSGDTLKADLKSEMREAVNEINADINSSQDLVQDQKTSDVATGRTLKDVHGNLVRVEQHIERPDSNTIGLINITKRDNYKYTGVFNAAPTGARIDTVELTASFNQTMPERLSGWGSFIIDLAEQDGINFHPENIRVEVANNVSGSSDKILVTSKWNATKDDMDEAVIEFISAKNGHWYLDTDANDLSDNGVTWDGIDEENQSGEIKMWGISPELRLFRDADGNKKFDVGETQKIVRVGIENWLINNDGKVLDVDTVLGLENTINPFEVLRNIAVENALMVRESGTITLIDGRDEYTSGEYLTIRNKFNAEPAFFKNNMDNILTPDIIIPVIEDIASDAVSEL